MFRMDDKLLYNIMWKQSIFTARINVLKLIAGISKCHLSLLRQMAYFLVEQKPLLQTTYLYYYAGGLKLFQVHLTYLIEQKIKSFFFHKWLCLDFLIPLCPPASSFRSLLLITPNKLVLSSSTTAEQKIFLLLLIKYIKIYRGSFIFCETQTFNIFLYMLCHLRQNMSYQIQIINYPPPPPPLWAAILCLLKR